MLKFYGVHRLIDLFDFLLQLFIVFKRSKRVFHRIDQKPKLQIYRPRSMRKITILVMLFYGLLQTLMAQEQVTYQQAFPNLSFQYPVEIQNAKDGSNRLFVVEQSGRIKVFQNSASTAQQQVFLDISNQISFSSGQEIGLLGLAFHPNYSQNGYFYVYHTRQSSVPNVNTEMVLARYQVSSNPNQANSSSRYEIFSFDKNQPNSNHNGGKIAFGPDGYLYVSIGDGGGGGDPQQNSQNLNNVFGSILRIDIDLNGNNPLESNPDLPNGRYEIPSDNPRVGQSGLDELYAWGIRNTWKFSFDNQTNRLWGADVGQNRFEEINLITKGGNYGWNRFEATTSQNSSTVLATNPDTKPVFFYNRNSGDVSITGGYVYRGSSNNTAIQGKYIYGDYVSGRVWALDYNANGSTTSRLLFRTSGQFVSSFGLDESGEMYFSGYGTAAKLFKIVGGQVDPGPTTVAVNGVGDWKELENGTNGIVEAITVDGDNTYVAGSFSSAGSISSSRIAVYNKQEGWKTLSSGANGTVYALAVATDGKLYAGGTFSSIGGVSAQNVAVWNGSSWAALGPGTNGRVSKIGVDSNNRVYVGGAFSTAGGILVNNIARWQNGWSALRDSGTSAIGTNNEIRAIAFDSNNNLYVGGNFDSAGGRTANRIATWNGSNWGTLGSGTSGFVQAIVVTSQSIYAGGNFTTAGGNTVNRIARWVRSSNTWQAMGNGASGNVNTMAFDGSYLYAGGNFETVANNTSTNYIVKNLARWSAAQGWQAMGPGTSVGVNNLINGIAFSDSNQRLYVGGNFNTAGNKSIGNIGLWSAQGFDCTDERLVSEYRINGTWSSGLSTLTVDQGTSVVLSLLPNNLAFTVTTPSGTVANGDFDLGSVDESAAGTYTFRTTGGCETTLNIEVNATNPCTANSVIPEYRLNGGNWTATGPSITIDEGDSLVLGIQSNETNFSITLPNGSSVNNDYTINSATTSQEGTYTFRTEEGCTENLIVNVLADTTVPCSSTSIVPEYRLGNGSWIAGESEITLDKGADITLGIKPDDLGFTITLPNGNSVNGDYTMNAIQTSQAGTYTFLGSNGCSASFTIIVIDDGVQCTETSVIQEYRIDGTWSSGDSNIEVLTGQSVVLSMLPNNIDFTITLPDGSIVNSDYNLGDVTVAQSGRYIITSEDGCSANLDVNVLGDEPCLASSVVPEYRIDGVWSRGESQLDINEGSAVYLSMRPGGPGSRIILPDGSQVGEGLDLGNITLSQSGIYTFYSVEGCSSILEINVITNSGCAAGTILPEYRLNGTWLSGQTNISVDEGTSVILSILPNSYGVTITLPNGSKVGDNYNLGAVTSADGGTYTFLTPEGCTTSLTLNVNTTDTSTCSGTEIINEYRINGKWQSGENTVRVAPGTELTLSMLPNGIPLSITTPNGQVFGDNLNLGAVSAAQSGVYLLETDEGCTSSITVEVTGDVDPCTLGTIIPEYRLDGKWFSGDNEITVDENTNVVLSVLPNNVDFTITLPDGSVKQGDYNIGNVTPSQSGIYILETIGGCKEYLQINVVDLPGCSANSVVPEYRLNGVWESGAIYLKVDTGTEVVLSILPNDLGLTITLPDGRVKTSDYNLGPVTPQHSGMYILTSSEGCKTAFELYVSGNGNSRSTDFEEFVVDTSSFENGKSAGDGVIAYPNPTIDRLSVDVRNLAEEAFTLIVTDMKQQQLQIKQFNVDHEDDIELDFVNYSSGIYFLVFKMENGEVITKRVVKK